MAPPVKWKPGGASPFARPAFPHGSAPYRPSSVAAATGLQTFGRDAPPIGGGPVQQYGDAPPVSWQGQWRPSEAELQRWGGRAVLYGTGVPDNAPTSTALDVLDATLPWPMGCDCVTVVEQLSVVPWATDVIVEVRAGIGRAGWLIAQRVKPIAGEPIITTFTRQPFRQISVRARWGTVGGVPPAAAEILAVSFGFGLVGL